MKAKISKSNFAIIIPATTEPRSLDGWRGVLLLSGTARRLDAKAWGELKRISGLD